MKQDLFHHDPLSLFSHELKTPLSTLNLSLSLLEQDYEKHKDLIPLMKKELDFLSLLICDGLDLRLIQKNKRLLACQWNNVYSLIEQNLSPLKALAEQKKLSFEVKANSDLELWADPLWLSCVLKNLFANAISFSVNNKPIVIEFSQTANKQLLFSITNTSAVKVDTKKVFDLFYTTSLKKQKAGTGLGLSLVQAIIKAHKGQIQCLRTKESSKSSSLEFSFVLPKSQLSHKKSA